MDTATTIETTIDYESIGKAYKGRKACTKDIRRLPDGEAGKRLVAAAHSITGRRDHTLDHILHVLAGDHRVQQEVSRLAKQPAGSYAPCASGLYELECSYGD